MNEIEGNEYREEQKCAREFDEKSNEIYANIIIIIILFWYFFLLQKRLKFVNGLEGIKK